ncbi:rRNA maturation RNase YbeY [Salegentibacter flavus]|uniref:Endoribonuclease YbeY n=1 Tax=Salegentibacter flavus TaxID=287099 RepID=A0A1I5A2N7_9FLAO|nr:rRNA maturation RNase YbeY [Salegentibacter flavus]SFN56509.1 rRNA maturation RNase YbeY [Salegentibacter flavus]
MSAEQEQINFFSETDFNFKDEVAHRQWLERVIDSEGKSIDEINFIFCDDDYLHKINLQYLDHDTYTDIISFDNSVEDQLAGDIFISVARVKENAQEFNVDFEEELKRVLVHGILHFCGFRDKTESERELMRQKEDEKIAMFHVEQ